MVENSGICDNQGWLDADEPVFWTGTDGLDLPDPEIGNKPQLYNLDAVVYESLMIGLFQIHLVPDNEVCEAGSIPKIPLRGMVR